MIGKSIQTILSRAASGWTPQVWVRTAGCPVRLDGTGNILRIMFTNVGTVELTSGDIAAPSVRQSTASTARMLTSSATGIPVFSRAPEPRTILHSEVIPREPSEARYRRIDRSCLAAHYRSARCRPQSGGARPTRALGDAVHSTVYSRYCHPQTQIAEAGRRPRSPNHRHPEVRCLSTRSAARVGPPAQKLNLTACGAVGCKPHSLTAPQLCRSSSGERNRNTETFRAL